MLLYRIESKSERHYKKLYCVLGKSSKSPNCDIYRPMFLYRIERKSERHYKKLYFVF